MKMKMTYEIARAAATDAGNRSMQKAGRKAWNAADYAVVAAEFNRLYPDEFRGEKFRLVNRESGSGNQTPDNY